MFNIQIKVEYTDGDKETININRKLEKYKIRAITDSFLNVWLNECKYIEIKIDRA